MTSKILTHTGKGGVYRDILLCIGIFIRSIKITNYFLFIIIHFHDLSSCSLRGLGRGRLHYLLAGEEGLVLRARDALDDDVEGDSRRQEELLPIVSAKSRHSAQKLQHQRDCPAINYSVKRRSNTLKETYKVWSS